MKRDYPLYDVPAEVPSTNNIQMRDSSFVTVAEQLPPHFLGTTRSW